MRAKVYSIVCVYMCVTDAAIMLKSMQYVFYWDLKTPLARN